MAKVSIVVPVYNVGVYLEECMESLIRQTLREIEIICVNDGSTDNSPEILRRYAEKDSRIVLINQENGGYGKAMNTGIDRAKGLQTCFQADGRDGILFLRHEHLGRDLSAFLPDGAWDPASGDTRRVLSG